VPDEEGFVFPSLLGKDEAEKPVAYQRESFFAEGNRFPAHDCFSWRSGESSIEIVVKRAGAASKGVEVSIDQPSLTELRRRDWHAVNVIQRSFRIWLLAGTRRLFDRERYFDDLDTALFEVWTKYFFAAAQFDQFARKYLNVPESFPVMYHGPSHDGLIQERDAGDPWELALALAVDKSTYADMIVPRLPADLKLKLGQIAKSTGERPNVEEVILTCQKTSNSVQTVPGISTKHWRTNKDIKHECDDAKHRSTDADLHVQSASAIAGARPAGDEDRREEADGDSDRTGAVSPV